MSRHYSLSNWEERENDSKESDEIQANLLNIVLKWWINPAAIFIEEKCKTNSFFNFKFGQTLRNVSVRLPRNNQREKMQIY